MERSQRRQPTRRRDEDDDDIDPRDRSGLLARLRDVTRQRNEAEEKLSDAIGIVKQLRTEHTTELERVKTESASSVTASVRRVEEGFELRGLMQDGDQDGVKTARRVYEELPAEKRPASIVDWFASLTPETAPRTLHAYLPPAGQDADPQTEKTGRRADPPPPVDRGRGKGKDKDPAEMTGEEYDAWLKAQSLARLTAAARGGTV